MWTGLAFLFSFSLASTKFNVGQISHKLDPSALHLHPTFLHSNRTFVMHMFFLLLFFFFARRNHIQLIDRKVVNSYVRSCGNKFDRIIHMFHDMFSQRAFHFLKYYYHLYRLYCSFSMLACCVIKIKSKKKEIHMLVATCNCIYLKLRETNWLTHPSIKKKIHCLMCNEYDE